jgi:hypothetical protein
MNTSTQLFGWFLEAGLGAVVTFFALLFACMIAFEEAKHSRLFASAVVTSLISTVPEIMTASGGEAPPWGTVVATISAYVFLVPLLSAWAGMNAAKAIYVSSLTFILVSVFDVLVSVSS